MSLSSEHSKSPPNGPQVVEQPYPYPPQHFPPPPGAYQPPPYYYAPPDGEHGAMHPYMMAFPPPPHGMVYAYTGMPPPGQGYSAGSSRPKRKQVKMACTSCAQACKRCDEARPCERCVKYGIADTCTDGQRKERKKGIKRGPYKRKNKEGEIQYSHSLPEGAEWPIQHPQSNPASSASPPNPNSAPPMLPPIHAFAPPPPPEGYVHPYYYPPPHHLFAPPPPAPGQEGVEGGQVPPVPYYHPYAGYPHPYPAYGPIPPPPQQQQQQQTIDPADAMKKPASEKGQENDNAHEEVAKTGKKRARVGKEKGGETTKTKKQKKSKSDKKDGQLAAEKDHDEPEPPRTDEDAD